MVLAPGKSDHELQPLSMAQEPAGFGIDLLSRSPTMLATIT